MSQSPITTVSLAVLLALSAGAAACSSKTPAAPSSGQSLGAGLLAYSACMRAHGVPGFPDPSASGGIPKAAVVSAMQAAGDAKAQAADNACYALMPSGGLGAPTETIPAKDQQDYLRAAACMRAHGVTDFPDPNFSGGGVSFNIPSSISLDSPAIVRARQICEQLIPAGLPDSGRSG